MEAILRCKLRVTEVLHRMEADGSTSQEQVALCAVISDTPENKQWSKYTPCADFKIWITNPAAMGKISAGREFYVDFTPALKAES